MLRALSVLGASAAAAALTVSTPALPLAWSEVSLSAAAAPARVRFSVAVRETNAAEVERIALAVSDPRSPSYGAHLSSAELRALTAPAAADVAAVKAWVAAAEGCAVLASSSTDRLLAVDCGLDAARALLATSFRLLAEKGTGRTVVRARAYTLPASVEHSVAAVFGLHGLPLPPRPRRADPAPTWGLSAPLSLAAGHRRLQEGGPANVTPAVIAQVYGVAGVTVDREGSNKQAVAEFQGQTMNETDLQTYFAMCDPLPRLSLGRSPSG